MKYTVAFEVQPEQDLQNSWTYIILISEPRAVQSWQGPCKASIWQIYGI